MALVHVDSVSKRYCRDLKRSLRYGLQDIVGDLLPGRHRAQDELRRDEFWALRDVSFEVGPGEGLGLVGPNGAGKSTMLKVLTGIVRPDAGEVRLRGRVASLIELGTGFNPVLTGRENVYVNAAVLGFDRAYVDRRIDRIVAFADIGDFLDTPVMNYSSGMYVRLAYAVAANLEPDVLLVDEVLAVGDAAFRRKCIRHMKAYVNNGGSLIVVSHAPPLLEMVCTRSVVMNDGRVDFEGPISEGMDRYFALLGTDAAASGMAYTTAGQSLPHASTEGPSDSETRVVDSRVFVLRPKAIPLSDENPVSVELVSIEPEQGHELRPEQPAIVTLTYRASRVLSGVMWWLELFSEAHGVVIATEACILEALSSGEGSVRARFPRLSLLAGRYALRTALMDVDQTPLTWVGWSDAPLHFTVAGEPSLLHTARNWGQALVSLDLELSTTDEQEAQEDRTLS